MRRFKPSAAFLQAQAQAASSDNAVVVVTGAKSSPAAVAAGAGAKSSPAVIVAGAKPLGVSSRSLLRRAALDAEKTGFLDLRDFHLTEVPLTVVLRSVARNENEGLESEQETVPWWEREAIKKIDLSSNLLKNIPAQMAEDGELCHNLQALLLAHNDLQELPASFSHFTRLQKLDVRNNRLQTLPDFSGWDCCHELYLANNELRNVAKELFSLPSLGTLDLSNNSHLQRLDHETQLSASVGVLKMESCGLTSLPSAFFENARALRELYLGNNLIENDVDISSLTSLQRVDLHDNRLTSLPRTLGASQLELREVLLGGNCISCLDTGSLLFDAPNLTVLNLRKNGINNLPQEVGNSRSLRILDLSDNNISRVLPELSKIKSLNEGRLLICGNPLRGMPSGFAQKEAREMLQVLEMQLPKDIDVQSQPARKNAEGDNGQVVKLCNAGLCARFDAASLSQDIRELDVSRNELTSLGDDDVWASLTSLTKVAARSNLLIELPMSICLLQFLTVIDVTNNRLITLPGDLFKLPRLRSLRAENNMIMRFDGLESGSDVQCSKTLEELFLSDNKITSEALPVKCLQSATALKVLDLCNNDMRHFAPELGLCESLISLRLFGNPCREIRQEMLRKPTADLLAYLRDRIDT